MKTSKKDLKEHAVLAFGFFLYYTVMCLGGAIILIEYLFKKDQNSSSL